MTAADKKRSRLKLYCSYALSSWGDRMWNFAISLALVCLWPTLRLAAVSGLVHGTAVFLAGASMGHWIDNVTRKRAAVTTLTINNTSITISASLLAVVAYWGHYELLFLLLAIATSTVAYVASMGSKVIVSRDWLVVLSDGDQETLAHCNAVLLRINLTAMILSPLIAGFVMRWLGVAAGCILIACWNIMSYVVELFLLVRLAEIIGEKVPLADSAQGESNGNSPRSLEPEAEQLKNGNTDDGSVVLEENSAENEKPEVHTRSSRSSGTALQRALNPATKVIGGWKTFYAQDAFPAGIALALLYFTVLGLCSLTTGYAYKQGITEDILAIVRGVSAMVGIAGSVAFPRLRSRWGLTRTGLISLSCQLSAALLCVVSIWVPGSPFDLSLGLGQLNQTGVADANETQYHGCVGVETAVEYEESQASVWMFLTGVVLARFGLWTADLSITQIFQETVPKSRRGIVGGVQQSLNQSLELLINGLVIILPYMHTFGLLIIASFTAIIGALSAMTFYAVKTK